jgi:hypothetical protein
MKNALIQKATTQSNESLASVDKSHQITSKHTDQLDIELIVEQQVVDLQISGRRKKSSIKK